MKNKLLLIMLLFSITIVGCNNKNLEANKQESIYKEKIIEGIKINSLAFNNLDNITTLNAVIKNETEEDKNITMIEAEFFDKDNKSIGKVSCYVGGIKQKETKNINGSATVNIEDIKRIEYSILK